MNNTEEKHMPFVMPEGYLEAFPAQMMAQIDTLEAKRAGGEQTPLKMRFSARLRQLTNYVAGVAAMFAFFFVCTQHGATPASAATTSQEEHPAYASLSHSDQMYDYLLMTTTNLYDYATTTE